jgi:hypothetical protein
MHEPCFSSQPTLVRELDHEGRKVRVSVWYGANTGPEDTGFGIIRDIGLDPRVRVFPVLKAVVDSSAFGYANQFGWIQVITHLRPDGSIEDWSPDPMPMMRDRGVPFTLAGYLPTFYDAPFWPNRRQLYWRADLFLCPLVVRRPSEEDVAPLAGFRWGFRIAAGGGEPELLPLETAGREAWSDSLPRLKFSFPSWRFAEWSAPYRDERPER